MQRPALPAVRLTIALLCAALIGVSAVCYALRAENARLRTALERTSHKIADGTWRLTCTEMEEMVRAAYRQPDPYCMLYPPTPAEKIEVWRQVAENESQHSANLYAEANRLRVEIENLQARNRSLQQQLSRSGSHKP